MKYPGFKCLLLVTTGFAHAFAQNSNPPPPKNPVLHRAPDMASWTVQFKYKADEAPAASAKPQSTNANQIQSLAVTKTHKTFWVQTVLASGKKDEKWVFDGHQLETVNNGKAIVIIAPPTALEPSPEYSDYSHTDFAGLDWVSLDAYKGLGSLDGKRVYQFESQKDGNKVIAMLSVDTQLPLYSSDGGTTCVYTYNQAPTVPLVPPEKFLAVLATYKKGLEAFKYHVSTP